MRKQNPTTTTTAVSSKPTTRLYSATATPRATPIPPQQDKVEKTPAPLNQTPSKNNLIPSTFYKTTISFSQKAKDGSPLSNPPSARKKLQSPPTTQSISTSSKPTTATTIKKPIVKTIPPVPSTPRISEPAEPPSAVVADVDVLTKFEVEEMVENVKMEQQQKFDEWKQQIVEEMHTILMAVQQLTNKVIQLESQVQTLQEKGEQKQLSQPIQDLKPVVEDEEIPTNFSNNTSTLSYPIAEEIRSDLINHQLTTESNISYSAKPVVLDEAELRQKLAAKDLLVDDTLSLHNQSDNFDDLLNSPINPSNSQCPSLSSSSSIAPNPKETLRRFNSFMQNEIEKELSQNAEFFEDKVTTPFLEQEDKVNNFIVTVVGKKLKLWDVQTNFCIQTISNNELLIHSATFLSDNLILISDNKAQVKLFDIEKGIDFRIHEIPSKEGDLISHLMTISNFCFICVNSRTNSVLDVWKLNSVGEWQHTCQMDCKDSITCIIQLQSHYLVLGTQTGSIKVYKLSNNFTVSECVATLTHHISVQCVCKLSNTTFASGGKGDTRIHLWEMKHISSSNGETTLFEDKGTLEGHTNTICSICKLSSKLVLSSSVQDHSLRVWNWKTRECLQTIKRDGQFQPISQLLRVSNDEFVTLSQAGQVQLWSKSAESTTFKEPPTSVAKDATNEVVHFIFGE